MNNILKWKIKSCVKLCEYYGQLLEYSLIKCLKRQKIEVHYSFFDKHSFDFKRTLCLFSSFDSEGIVQPYVFFYLEQLRAAGLDLIFVSTSSSISPTDKERLRAICAGVISRSNRGYDFFSWKTAMWLYPDYVRHSGLLLVNDSVFGPLFSLKKTFEHIKEIDADVIGITDSLRYKYHLQSYFLFFKPCVVSSKLFIDFFSRIKPIDYKGYIIRKYEVGLSRTLKKRFKLASLIPTSKLYKDKTSHIRPLDRTSTTIHEWEPLIIKYECPFIKRSLVTSGKLSIENIVTVLNNSQSNYDLSLIK